MQSSLFRLLAFFLPQYHPIPENDNWWGEGFTEWTNVRRAQPLFKGHYQPHLPGELGYYDLRDPGVRQAQADLAQEYGIHGFCYYHYWFNGKRLLEQPFNQVLASSKPALPFCLCWANEAWTRNWDGGKRQILMQQQYSPEDDRNHIRWLIPVFEDPRYIRVNGKPVFLVYRAADLPKPIQTTETWREEARKVGIGELYLCRVESFPDEQTDPRSLGFDAAVEFQPDSKNLPVIRKILRRVSLETRIPYTDVYDYAAFTRRMLKKPSPGYLRFPGLTPGWDNTARRKTQGTILHHSTPEAYQFWLQTILRRFHPPTQDENLVFINAWNEWGEGNHLEPCQKWGRGYLEATQAAIGRTIVG